MKKFLWIIMLLGSWGAMESYAQDVTWQEALEARNEVWGWELPAFQNYDVPEAYRNESAVILAKHRSIEATGKKSSGWRAFMTGNNAGKLFYTDVQREMVKINDQTALDRYSDLSFVSRREARAFMYSDKIKTVVGVRIIKPDHQILEVNVDQNAVSVTEGKNNEEAFKKLAIPDLQVGDILDYFYYRILELETENIRDYMFPFYTVDAPVLSYSVHCELGQYLTVEYRSINGAPSFVSSMDEAGNVILDAEAKDLLRVYDLDNQRWVSIYRDLPMIRFSVLQNDSRFFYKPASARSRGVYKDVKADLILQDAMGYLAAQQNTAQFIVYERRAKARFEEDVENFKQQHPTWTDRDLITYIALHHHLYWKPQLFFYYNPQTYVLSLYELLKNNGLKAKLGFANSQLMAPFGELFDCTDLVYCLTAAQDSLIFFPGERYMIPGEVPACYEGEPLHAIAPQEFKPTSTNAVTIVGLMDSLQIPAYGPEQNQTITRLEASFSDENPMLLRIHRSATRTGEVKREMQPYLFLFEIWDRELREYLSIDRTYLQEQEENKSTRKKLEETRNELQKQQEEYVDQVKQEIYIFHQAEPRELIDYTIHHLGVTPDYPALEYEMTYTLEGLVKKAGNNLILDVGKLIGTQYVPTAYDRKRNTNAYIGSPLTVRDTVSVAIPEGYEVRIPEGINSLVDNEYGRYASSVRWEDGQLKVISEKIYKRPFVPKEQFGNMVEMLDAANAFYGKSVVLEKR